MNVKDCAAVVGAAGDRKIYAIELRLKRGQRPRVIDALACTSDSVITWMSPHLITIVMIFRPRSLTRPSLEE